AGIAEPDDLGEDFRFIDNNCFVEDFEAGIEEAGEVGDVIDEFEDGAGIVGGVPGLAGKAGAFAGVFVCVTICEADAAGFFVEDVTGDVADALDLIGHEHVGEIEGFGAGVDVGMGRLLRDFGELRRAVTRCLFGSGRGGQGAVRPDLLRAVVAGVHGSSWRAARPLSLIVHFVWPVTLEGSPMSQPAVSLWRRARSNSARVGGGWNLAMSEACRMGSVTGVPSSWSSVSSRAFRSSRSRIDMGIVGCQLSRTVSELRRPSRRARPWRMRLMRSWIL